MSTAILAGQRVIVVGGASGIGLATVDAVAAAGGTVAVFDRDADGAARAASRVGASAYTVDIADEDQVRAAIDTAVSDLGGLEAVLHVAGVMRGQELDIRDLSAELWSEVLSVNLTGPFLVAKHAARHMIPAGSGTMVFVASRAGILAGSGSIPYGASKGGLQGFALSLDRQLRPRGIRVHTLCPGDIDTPLMRRSLEEAVANGADSARVAQIQARLGRADDVAGVLALLASSAASGFDGTVFTV